MKQAVATKEKEEEEQVLLYSIAVTSVELNNRQIITETKGTGSTSNRYVKIWIL